LDSHYFWNIYYYYLYTFVCYEYLFIDGQYLIYQYVVLINIVKHLKLKYNICADLHTLTEIIKKIIIIIILLKLSYWTCQWEFFTFYIKKECVMY